MKGFPGRGATIVGSTSSHSLPCSAANQVLWYPKLRVRFFKSHRMSDVTQILLQIESGDPTAADKLFPLVYEELRRLASAYLTREEPGQTLQATALVHEAYVGLIDSSNSRSRVNELAGYTLGQFRPDGHLVKVNAGSVGSDSEGEPPTRVWRSRSQFFAAASKAMRHILVNNARRKQAQKRGGERRRNQLVDVASPETMSPSDLLDLDDALERFAHAYPRHAKLVELQFFAGVTQEEAADFLGISVATARRHWDFARAWLFGQLSNSAFQEMETDRDRTNDR